MSASLAFPPSSVRVWSNSSGTSDLSAASSSALSDTDAALGFESDADMFHTSVDAHHKSRDDDNTTRASFSLSTPREHHDAAAITRMATPKCADSIPRDLACVPPCAPPVAYAWPDRFTVMKSLSRTIFGELHLCADRAHPGRRVVVKVSDQTRMHQQHGHRATVQEDVRKEASIMRVVGLQQAEVEARDAADMTPLTAPLSVDPLTCGLSASFLRMHAAAPSSHDLSPDALSSIASGRQFLSSIVGEFETPNVHCLVTSFAERGDLFNIITESQLHDGGRIINERQARTWFRQLCLGVQYLHAQSVAHLDLSVENVCIDAKGRVQIIDFGLAARHPRANTKAHGREGEEIVNHVRLVDEVMPANNCFCRACTSSTRQLHDRANTQIQHAQAQFPLHAACAVKDALVDHPADFSPMDVDCGETGVVDSSFGGPIPSADSDASLLAASCRFMLRPICARRCKPGKLSYMPPELYDARDRHAPFDAYKADIFSLGVILFILITGVPPFAKASETEDTWFQWFLTGEWMAPHRCTLPIARHYAGLSPNAWSLLDAIFKPQHLRPSIDQILAHPWMDETDPMSQPIDRTKKM